MPDEERPWVVIAVYGAVLEADFAAETLREAGIPAHVAGAHIGIWGAGYQGPSLHGVQLLVPYHRADEARELLEGEPLEPEEEE